LFEVSIGSVPKRAGNVRPRARRSREEDRFGSPHPLNLLMRKAPRYELFGVRIGNNVDRLGFVLQRANDIVQKLLAVREEGGDYVLTCRAYSHAVSGLVVGAERQALPHGDRLSP
jgi:hypothetical protein